MTPQGVVAHVAIASLVNHTLEKGEAGGFLFETQDDRKEEHGRYTLMTGHAIPQESMTRQISDTHSRACTWAELIFTGPSSPF